MASLASGRQCPWWALALGRCRYPGLLGSGLLPYHWWASRRLPWLDAALRRACSFAALLALALVGLVCQPSTGAHRGCPSLCLRRRSHHRTTPGAGRRGPARHDGHAGPVATWDTKPRPSWLQLLAAPVPVWPPAPYRPWRSRLAVFAIPRLLGLWRSSVRALWLRARGWCSPWTSYEAPPSAGVAAGVHAATCCRWPPGSAFLGQAAWNGWPAWINAGRLVHLASADR